MPAEFDGILVEGPYVTDAECTMGLHCAVTLEGTMLKDANKLLLADRCSGPPTNFTGFVQTSEAQLAYAPVPWTRNRTNATGHPQPGMVTTMVLPSPAAHAISTELEAADKMYQ